MKRSPWQWTLVLLITLTFLAVTVHFATAGASTRSASVDAIEPIKVQAGSGNSSPSAPLDTLTILANPGFEEGWTQSQLVDRYDAAGTYLDSAIHPEIFTPNGWTAFFKHGLPVPWDGANDVGFAQPEIHVIQKVDPFLDPPRIHSGQWALKLFTSYTIHDAGLYQQVPVTPGIRLRLSAYVHAWTSDENDPYQSTTDDISQAWQMVGLDPTGGTDPYADTVIWSLPANVYDTYDQTKSAVTTARSNTVTVFIRSGVKWPFKHNDMYWDTVTLGRPLHSSHMYFPVLRKETPKPKPIDPTPTPPPPPAGDTTFGVVFVNPAESIQVDEGRYQKSAALGIGWDRWPLYWYNVESSTAQYDWAIYDAVVEADLSHGLQINPILMGTPGFYATGGLDIPAPELGFQPATNRFNTLTSVTMSPPAGLYEPIFADGSDIPSPGKTINPNNPWAKFVYLAVDRYRPGGGLAQEKGKPSNWGMRVWEMWNEPDLSLFWGGSVADYARLLKVGAIAARQADRDAVIIVGGLANPPAPGYLEALLNQLAQDSNPDLRDTQGWYFDVVALHNYAWSWDTGERIRQANQVLNNFRTVYPALPKAPIWVNESGVSVYDDYPGPTWQNNGEANYMATMEEQAAYVIQNAAYALYHGAQVIFHFQLYDGCGNDPAGTDFPPDALDLCGQQICASASAFGLWRNKETDSCYRQHPEPDTERPAFGAFRVAVRHLTGAQPLWHQQPNGDQEWFAFYRADTKQRLVVLWANKFHGVTAQVPAVAGQAVLLDQDEHSQTLYPNNGYYEITLPAATNKNEPNFVENPQDLGPDDISSIGGRPFLLIESWNGFTD